MDITQIEKLRRMNLGGIADDIESIISRNARLTADNRRHMQRIEALERDNGQMILQIQNGGMAPTPKQEPVGSVKKWIDSNTAIVSGERMAEIYGEEKLYSAQQPAQAPTIPPEWREAVQEFVDRVEAGQLKSKHTYAKFKALLGGVQ